MPEDILTGGALDDALTGTDSDDTVTGGRGEDTLIGGLGNDVLNGGADDDDLNGGDGDDTLLGGAGNDQLEGGPGADILDGGDGTDSILIPFNSQSVVIDLIEGIATDSGGVTDTLIGIETIINQGTDTTITGSELGDSFILAGGSAVITGGGGDDQFIAFGSFLTLTLTGGEGQDFFDVSDTLGSNITITDFSEDDVLDFGISFLLPFDQIISSLEQVDGDIIVELLPANFTTVILQNVSIEDLSPGQFAVGPADDQEILGLTDFLSSDDNGFDVDLDLIDGIFGDIFSGSSLSDIISGTIDADNLQGGGGDDLLFGDFGNDFLNGGAGIDTILGGEGDDEIFAGPGDDSGDLFVGGLGSDAIGGGPGDDIIVGVAAGFGETVGVVSEVSDNDSLFGGSGNDTLIAGFFDDFDDDGEVDSGEIFTFFNNTSNALFAGSGDDVLNGANGADTLGGGTGNDTLFANIGNDVLFAGPDDGDDILFGSFGDDLAFGNAGQDELFGESGVDTLFGGAGEDTLSGGAGGDSLFGGAGSDILIGGDDAEPDIFFFAGDHGVDFITDFETGFDTLFLVNTVTDFASLDDVLAAAVETLEGTVSGVLIDTGGGNSVFLAGVLLADLSVENFVLD